MYDLGYSNPVSMDTGFEYTQLEIVVMQTDLVNFAFSVKIRNHRLLLVLFSFIFGVFCFAVCICLPNLLIWNLQ